MNGRRWRAIGAVAGAVLAVVACGSSDGSAPSSTTKDAGPSTALGPGNGNGDPALVATDQGDASIDAALCDGSVCESNTEDAAIVCTPPLPGPGGLCNALPSAPLSGGGGCDPGSPPAMTGGTIREGRYVEVTQSGFAGCTPVPFPFGSIIQVCGGTWFTSLRYNGFDFFNNSTFVTSGASITFTKTCDGGPQGSLVAPDVTYTATDTDLVIVNIIHGTAFGDTVGMARYVRQD